MPKADPAQQPPGHRADNRPQLTAHRKQRKPLGAAAFSVIALAGAGLFLLALLVLFFCLPADGQRTQTRSRVPWLDLHRQGEVQLVVTQQP
jgi:hypothetical protein